MIENLFHMLKMFRVFICTINLQKKECSCRDFPCTANVELFYIKHSWGESTSISVMQNPLVEILNSMFWLHNIIAHLPNHLKSTVLVLMWCIVPKQRSPSLVILIIVILSLLCCCGWMNLSWSIGHVKVLGIGDTWCSNGIRWVLMLGLKFKCFIYLIVRIY